MSGRAETTEDRASRRLDQWLWFARFAKSRSLAARLCAEGAVVVNGIAVAKANHAVRPGDIVSVPQGPWLHTVRVLALGTRRGPAVEARILFRETQTTHRSNHSPVWDLLLADDER